MSAYVQYEETHSSDKTWEDYNSTHTTAVLDANTEVGSSSDRNSNSTSTFPGIARVSFPRFRSREAVEEGNVKVLVDTT